MVTSWGSLPSEVLIAHPLSGGRAWGVGWGTEKPFDLVFYSLEKFAIRALVHTKTLPLSDCFPQSAARGAASNHPLPWARLDVVVCLGLVHRHRAQATARQPELLDRVSRGVLLHHPPAGLLRNPELPE
jgi:hypothetical protein